MTARDPGIVERGAELTVISSVIELAAAGPVAHLLCGEAGIGKTTLWRHAVTRAAARGHRVLSCRAAEAEVRLSFSGLVDLLERVPAEIVGELPVPQRDALDRALLRRSGDGEIDRRAVYTAVLSVVRALAAAGPVTLAVDDMQWLDAPTSDVLEYVLRRLEAEPVLFVASVRTTGEDLPPLIHAPILDGDHLHLTRLGGLGIDGLHRLLRGRTGDSWPRPALVQLHSACGGNPFFALEIARVGRDGGALRLPGSVIGLVRDRIESLPARTRRALLYAAAMPQPTVADVHAALPGAEALRDAEDAGVVELRAGRVRFAHPLLASTTYTIATPGERRRAHARLAATTVDVEARARHLALAALGPNPRIVPALEEAARLARARGAPAAAARLWELAAEHSNGQDTVRLLANSAECLFFAGDAAGARSRYEAALAAVESEHRRVRLLLDLALAVFYEEGPTYAVSLCDRALEAARDDPALRAVAHLRRAWYFLNDHRERALSAARALDILDRAEPPPDLLALALVSKSWFGFHAGLGFSSRDLRRARELIPPEARSRESTMARNALRVFHRYLDPLGGRTEIEAARAAAAERGDESATMQSQVHLAELDCWTGDFRRARELAERAYEAAEQTGQKPWQPYALYALAQAKAGLGELDEARRDAERGVRTALGADDTWVAFHHLAVLGFIALSDEDAESADRTLTRARDLCYRTNLADPGICDPHGDHIEASVLLGDLPRARQLLTELEHRYRAAPRPWLEAVLARSAAVVYTAAGDLAAAEEELSRALAIHETLSMPLSHGRTLLAKGRLCRRGREKLAARDALLAARRIFDGLAARRWAAQATAELRRLGLRRGEATELTPTEERIAGLVAGGMSNREVAAAAYVTTKTVEAHLSRIYRKLGIRSRRELARLGALSESP